MKTILETEHLLFREMIDGDFDALKKVIRDHQGNICEDSYVKKWIDWCISSYQKYGFGHYAVIYKATNEMIGSAGPSMQYIDDEWRPEIGYHLRSDFHRQGLGKEAAIGLRDYFFKHFDYDAVYSYMDVDNIPSYKTAECMGMKYLHTFKGKYCDEYRVYRITKDEWKDLLKIENLQPSQFYISEEKVKEVKSWFNPNDLSNFEPIPIKILDSEIIMTDGHTRAVVALNAGIDRVPLIWDNDDLDWDMYIECVKECQKNGVFSPKNLQNRIISEKDYDDKWNKWCDKMQEDVRNRRRS